MKISGIDFLLLFVAYFIIGNINNEDRGIA
jgi:hypothetical protein